MGVIYQLTFFLALGLLAIVITIFVFAVAQLGRAIEVSSKQQQDILSQAEGNRTKRIEGIEKQIEEVKKTGSFDYSELSSELQGLTQERMQYESELKRISGKLERMKVKGGVICPGALFLTALILSGLATFLDAGQDNIAISLWVVSIAALCFGGWEVYKNLKVIEEVTTTSQETIDKLPKAVKEALRELEEERKPELLLEFPEEKLPIKMSCLCENEVEVLLGLVRGDEAVDTIFYIAAPPEFEFVDAETYTQSANHPYVPNYVTLRSLLGSIKKGINQPVVVKIKAPGEKGKYNLYYRIVCSGFDSGQIPFQVVVK